MNETRFLAGDDDAKVEEIIAPPPTEVPQPVELPEGVKEPQVFDDITGMNMTQINEKLPSESSENS